MKKKNNRSKRSSEVGKKGIKRSKRQTLREVVWAKGQMLGGVFERGILTENRFAI